MKNSFKKIDLSHFALLGILVVVIVGGFTLFKQDRSIEASGVETGLKVSEEAPSVPSNMDTFAKCLNESGAVLYGAVWCPHCQSQKKTFGESVQFINYVECSPDGSKTQAEVCVEAGIQGYPTWQFADGSEILGSATFKQLSEKTSCSF